MLSDDRIRELFLEYLPDNVVMLTLPAKDFVEQARGHSFIQMQIQMGVYSDDNIADDFLSPARAHPDISVQIICSEIFNNILDGITVTIAEDYVRSVAAHEAHHFHHRHEPVSAADHAASEVSCIQEVNAAHPELAEAVSYVEAHSPVYRRVYDRISIIQQTLSKVRNRT